MTRLEKLKSLCASNVYTKKNGEIAIDELSALLALVEQMAAALHEFRDLGTGGGCYPANEALTAFAAWNGGTDA